MLSPANANATPRSLRKLKVPAPLGPGHAPVAHHALLFALTQAWKDRALTQSEVRCHVGRGGQDLVAGWVNAGAGERGVRPAFAAAANTGRRRTLAFYCGAVCGPADSPVVVACGEGDEYRPNFDVKFNAAKAVEWWEDTVQKTLWPAFSRLSAVPLPHGPAGHFLVGLSQQEWAAGSLGREVVLPPGLLGRVLAEFQKAEEPTKWAMLEALGAVMASAARGVPVMLDRLLLAYHAVDEFAAAAVGVRS